MNLEKERLANNQMINYLRLVFAMLVALVHYQSIYSLNGYFARGGVAVEFFFILSGSFMAAEAVRTVADAKKSKVIEIGEQTFLFIKKKMIKILPAYIVCWDISFVCYVVCNKVSGIESIWTEFELGIPELLFLHSTGIQSSYFLKQTWFLSAMFLAMAVCYPMLLKYMDIYSKVIAPLTAVLLLGYISAQHGYILWDVDSRMGIVSKGVLRACAEINFGVFIYGIVRRFCKKRLNLFGKILFFILSFLTIGNVLLWAILPSEGNAMDFVMVVLMAIGIAALFILSENGILTHANFTEKFAKKMSIYVYFSHRIILDYYMPIVGVNSVRAHVFIYLLSVIVLSILICYCCELFIGLLAKRKFKINIFEVM